MKRKKKTQRKILIYLSVVLIAIAAVFATYGVQKLTNKLSYEISVEEAQEIIEDAVFALPNNVSPGAKFVAENMTIKANSVSFGTDKNAIVECDFSAPAIGEVVVANIEKYMSGAYSFYEQRKAEGKKTNSTNIKLHLAKVIEEDIRTAGFENGKVNIEIYETAKGVFEVYLSDELVNTIFGGILDAEKAIRNVVSVEYKGGQINIANQNTLRTGVNDYIALSPYSSKIPDTSVPLEKVWNNFKYDFYRNFIEKNRWTYLTNGLGNTLAITFFAVLLGILIGFITAIIRCLNQKTGKAEFLSDICKVYVAVMRGMPVMVQLIIMYFVILLPMGVDKFIAAVICFGLNSGAYVSEIIRGGIMSIDDGQTEAGRSLGFTYMQTMTFIILPQAFKAVLPALANEFIALLKESSIAFYIGFADLTLGGIKIRSITYSNFMPLLTVGVIYLVVVLGLSKLVSILERRLSKGDKR
jgi:polar amino acid transport system permease protein/polar amino acid transport system substrate-binding protein